MASGWAIPMFIAGACSAGAIVLIRNLPTSAPGLPATLTVAIYMLIGGTALFLSAGLSLSGLKALEWPAVKGLGIIAGIGLLLAALEFFFVIGARAGMPLPDALILYNITSLAFVAVAGVLLFGESLTAARIIGLGFGVVSLLLLLQPATKS